MKKFLFVICSFFLCTTLQAKEGALEEYYFVSWYYDSKIHSLKFNDMEGIGKGLIWIVIDKKHVLFSYGWSVRPGLKPELENSLAIKDGQKISLSIKKETFDGNNADIDFQIDSKPYSFKNKVNLIQTWNDKNLSKLQSLQGQAGIKLDLSNHP